MEIIKASGDKAIFKKSKIEKTAILAGAPKKLAKEVANKVEKKIHKGTKTSEILNLTLKFLKVRPEIAARYDLKRAIMSLGPSGFPFEEFFSQVLKHYGYKTTVGNLIKGKAVRHEIDIVAKKKKSYMIEAKYHNSPGVHTDTKVAMYTYARFLDLKSNPKNIFEEPWLVTNTRCTSRAIKYSEGVGLKIISWKYPREGNLQQLLEDKGLYPITIFKTISKDTKEKLFKAKIVLANDLANHSLNELNKKTGLNRDILKHILKEIEEIRNVN
jgi:hypothetical protein